jgi:hypothetical protein
MSRVMRLPRRGWLLVSGAFLFGTGMASAPIFAQPARAAPAEILDRFEFIAPWQAIASDGARASIASVPGPALRLDFDLGGTAGYAGARRTLSFDLPANYELSFDLRAEAPVNDFQFKLADASGENVWWYQVKDFDFPVAWRHIRIKKRQIDFAWGPTSERTLRHAASVEFIVRAGRGGGSGSLYIANLALRELPPPHPPSPPIASASSSLAGAGPERALDGDGGSAWRSDPAAGKVQSFTLDLGEEREFGGLVLRWLPDAFASHYDVLLSRDGERWRTVYNVVDGSGGPDALRLPESEARYVRLALADGPGAGYALAEIEVEELAFGATANAFVAALAREAARGSYPRGFSGEQPYWTVVGIEGGRETGLLSEDGGLEVRAGGFSIEPFVVAGGRVYTWADVSEEQSLVDGYLPMPSVAWRGPGWQLRVTALADGTPERSGLLGRYEIANDTAEPLALTLALAVRPFQVNPPAQFLNTVGGVSPIHDIAWDGAALLVDGTASVSTFPVPDRVGAFSFGAGPVPHILARQWRDAHSVHDGSGFATAVLAYRFALAPREKKTVGLVVPLTGRAAVPVEVDGSAAAWFDARESALAAGWRQKLDRVRVRLPRSAQAIADTLRSALAQILVTRDGAVLRPGTRSYSRSWIRDGTMISEALLRLAHPDAAADFLRWYAPYQFANGKIPCCIDARGADPVPENDSPGEFIFLAAEIYRYTADRALLEAMWPHVRAAADYLETLRQSERTPANLEAPRRGFYGMLPASISHEGYAAKPVHSYWDDFWALKGYDSAVLIARALDRGDDAQRFARERDSFRADLARSLAAAIAAHGIDHLPGSVELGDFDPTSTSIAFAPDGEPQDLRPAWVRATYERYWREFLARRDGLARWDDYTPYELRNVATFVRLGWRERALALLDFFLQGRRPSGWNQWAEVVGRDARTPRFIGDMPHAWVASDFIRSMLDLFVYERTTDRSLVLAAGVPGTWLDEGVAIDGLRTPYGTVGYALSRDGSRIVLDLAAGARVPPGGFVFAWPFARPPGPTWINGRLARWHNGELIIRELRARVEVGGGREFIRARPAG